MSNLHNSPEAEAKQSKENLLGCYIAVLLLAAMVVIGVAILAGTAARHAPFIFTLY